MFSKSPKLVWLIIFSMTSSLVIGCGGGIQKHGSPEAVFNAAGKHAESSDFKSFVGCLTPDSQDLMVGSMAMGAVMMKAFAGFGGQLGGDEAKQDMESKFAKIDKVLEKHGMTEEKLKTLENGGLTDPEAGMKEIAALVKDKGAFLEDLLTAFESLGDEGKDAKQMTDAFSGELKDLKIDGDTATASLVFTADGQERTQPIDFKKVDGGWLIHLSMDRSGP